MKVLLFALNGSYAHTNLAVRCLRRTLERDGFEVKVLERNLRDSEADILSDISDAAEGASLVGFSVYIWNVTEMLRLAENFKKIRPDCTIVFGGPEVTFGTERFEKLSFVDCIIRGEGEDSIVSLAKAVKNGTSFPKVYGISPASDVMRGEGILYRKGDRPSGSVVYYESSRGCPYSCSYCLSSAATGMKRKSTDEVFRDMKEFESLHEDIKIIKFVDRTFNFPVSRANEIWSELLKEEYTKSYHFEICANLLNEESFEILAKFPPGKIQFEIGLQSTNPDTLNEISRHLNGGEILKNAARLKALGNIHIHLDLIAGLPFESYDRFKKSFDDAYFCCDMLQLGFLKFLHGTAIRENAGKYGCEYTSEAPYTVLKTDSISYSELSRLRRISETLKRYHESGKFSASVDFAVKCFSSPFSFYEGLTDRISATGKRMRQFGQADAFDILYSYCESFMTKEELTVFAEKLLSDFNSNESGRLPPCLRKKQQ